jgi:hypothetical protein
MSGVSLWGSQLAEDPPSDWRRNAEEPILKEPIKTFVGIVSINIPMSVAHANMIHALYFRLRLLRTLLDACPRESQRRVPETR